jgi:hypothetical protein
MADKSSSQPFWKAVSSNVVAEAREFLAQDASLASKGFRPVGQQREDPHNTRFPYVKACQCGFGEVAELLLQHGADVDAKTPTED